MASVKQSGIGPMIAGTFGNTIIQRNQWGFYARTAPGPAAVPWLAAQQALVASITNEWQSTTDDNRMLWIEAAGYSKNKLTTRVALKGFQLFMRTNLNLNLVGVGSTMQPVPAVPLLIFSTFTLTYLLGNLTAAWTPNPLSGVWRALIYASPMVSPGRMTPSQPYALIAQNTAGLASMALSVPYSSHYGAFIPGRKIWAKIIAINWTTGQRAPAQYAYVNI